MTYFVCGLLSAQVLLSLFGLLKTMHIICCVQVVVDFTATWCGPCRVISPVFVELSKKFPEIFFLKVDVDELRDVAQEWDVEAMPTFIFIRDGRAVDKVVGAKKDDLERKVAALAAAAAEAALVAQA